MCGKIWVLDIFGLRFKSFESSGGIVKFDVFGALLIFGFENILGLGCWVVLIFPSTIHENSWKNKMITDNY